MADEIRHERGRDGSPGSDTGRADRERVADERAENAIDKLRREIEELKQGKKTDDDAITEAEEP